MGMGAPIVGAVPSAHVDRLLTAGLNFCVKGFDSCKGAVWIGFALGSCCGTAGALSLAISDLLNQDGFAEKGDDSFVSLADLKLRSECFRPRSRAVEDFGRRGSTASLKYSWPRACFEVGRFFGSHIKHDVTKLLNEAGHCGDCRMVSIECGAIYDMLAIIESDLHLDRPLEMKIRASELVLFLLASHLHQL